MQLQTILFAVIVPLIFFSLRSLYRTWRQGITARQLGCMPVRKYPHTRPWGLDLYHERTEAAKDGRYSKLFLEHFQKYGKTWEEQTFDGRIINTIEPANIQTVAALKFNDYSKIPKRTKVLLPFLGHGLFSQNGKEWRRSRDIVTPLFKRAELTDVDGFKKFVDRMIDLIPRDGSTVDLQPLCEKLFMDSSTEFIFGESVNLLLDESAKSNAFLNAFNQSLAGAAKRGNIANGNLNFLFMFDKTWEENYSQVHAFVDRNIARTLAEIDSESAKDSKEEQNSFNAKDSAPERKRYVLIYQMAKEVRDPIALRFHLLNVFLPARDGTAIAVSHALFHLARNPSIWTELRKQALALGNIPITFEVLQGLPYFRYTLQEAIRLQGPAGRNQRLAIRDTTLPRGGGPDGAFPVFVPKGTIVATNSFPGSRNQEVWGEDVETFRPSRFEGRTIGWEFTPFFGGPRICPAQQQVITQGTYLLLRLVQEFKAIENRDECLEYVEFYRMLGQSRNGVKVALHPSRDA